MNLTFKSLSTLFILALGVFIGASALQAVAYTWTAPSGGPGTTNVAPPINVGTGTQQLHALGTLSAAIQEKSDSLAIDGNLGVLGTLSAIYLNVASGTASTTAGSVLVNDGRGNASWGDLSTAPSTECDGSGLIHVISNNEMNDNGVNSSGDSMEIYCRNGVSRWCLSGESCPWRADIASADNKVCSASGLNTNNHYPGNTSMILMASAWGDLWQPYTVYYCSADGTQKAGYYISSLGNVSCGASPTSQLRNLSVTWSSLSNPTGGDNTNYTYAWSTNNSTWYSGSTSTTTTYTTTGTKNMYLKVTSNGNSKSVACSPNVTIN